MGKFKEMLCGMNPKVVSYIQDNPDIVTEVKNDLNAKLDAMLDTDYAYRDTILNEFRIELIYRISRELSRQTQESYIDCMEVAEFYTERLEML